MDIRVDLGRLKKDIEDLGGIGRDSRGGISRPSFSRADLEARAWLKDRIRSAGFELRQDGAGNIFGRWGGQGQAVMAGSHIDTVVNGGMFDGSCGVLAALECLRRVKEEKLTLSKPLELASFTDEEGNLVGDFLGSRAFLGGLKQEFHCAAELVAPPAEQLRHAQTDGRVRVVAAGMFDAGHERFVGHVNRFVDRQGVHVRAHGDAGTGLGALEQRHDAVSGDAGLDLIETQRAQPVGHDTRGALLAIGQLRVHVEVAAGLDQSGPQRLGGLRDFCRVRPGRANGRTGETKNDRGNGENAKRHSCAH